jgi:hypothetical protein
MPKATKRLRRWEHIPQTTITRRAAKDNELCSHSDELDGESHGPGSRDIIQAIFKPLKITTAAFIASKRADHP